MTSAPTLLDRAAAPPPPTPKRGRWLWAALGAILLAAGIIGAIASRTVTSSPPAVTATHPAPAPVQPTSTTAVSVTAPPAPQIIETKTTTAPPPVLAAPPPTQSAPPPAPAARSADDLYNEAMSQLAGGDWPEARKTLHRVLLEDPHYAKAHFRMGQISMFNRNFAPALVEYKAAMNDADRLDERERYLTRIGLAVSSGNRAEAEQLGREMRMRWPRDLELARIVREFGGEGRLPGRPPLRPRWRKP